MFATTFLLALRSIRRHLLRSFLTTLGIIIGVAAVVTMVTLGKATTAAVQQQIAALGTNVLQIRPGQGFGRGGGGPRPPEFKPEDATAIREQIAGVAAVDPQVQSSATVVHAGANWSTTVNGVSNSFFDVQSWALTDGRSFTAAEQSAGRAVCIIGNTVKLNLYPNEEPVGSRLRVAGISCDVIGVLATKGQAGFGGDQDDVVLMPIKAVQRRLTGSRDIRALVVGVDKNYASEQVQSAISDLLRERRGIGPGKDDNFNIFDSKQLADTLTGTTTLLTSIVTAVAAISLVVGGIGIMNIMLVSVTERTREIGIRLAIGAIAREVLLQFLVEAVTLSCLGGLIGLLIAQIAIGILAIVVKVPFLFVPGINLLAFAIAAAIGVVFGYVPARRAASLNPIEALRHE